MKIEIVGMVAQAENGKFYNKINVLSSHLQMLNPDPCVYVSKAFEVLEEAKNDCICGVASIKKSMEDMPVEVSIEMQHIVLIVPVPETVIH